MYIAKPHIDDHAAVTLVNNRAMAVFQHIYSDAEKAAYGDDLVATVDEFSDVAATREFICCKIDGIVTGFAIYRRKNAQTVWISSLYVDPPYQRRGIGAALLGHIEGFARAQGCTTVALETHAKAAWAIRFYKRSGYAVVNDHILLPPYGHILDKPPIAGHPVMAKAILQGE